MSVYEGRVPMHRDTSLPITMKQKGEAMVELGYFEVDGAIGGNQDGFSNVVMHIGGCAAAAACDSCIYFAKHFGNTGWYPFDVEHLTQEDYVRFSQMMKPYIKPRVGGVKNPEWFVEGFYRYLKDHFYPGRPVLRMEVVRGEASQDQAWEALKSRIDQGLPVPFLLLRHHNREVFEDYIWHWFMVIGYEESKEDLLVQTATYGEKKTFSFAELWNTGFEERGGMVLYDLDFENPDF